MTFSVCQMLSGPNRNSRLSKSHWKTQLTTFLMREFTGSPSFPGERNMSETTSPSSIAQVLKSSVNQNARTPDWLLQKLTAAHFGSEQPFDPCPNDPQFDGLTVPWQPKTFVNPPFNQMAVWLTKAVEEGKRGNHIVFLLPARISTKYFHKLLVPAAKSVTIWCKPVAFPPHKAPFSLPILTVEFGECNADRLGLKPALYSSIWDPSLNVSKVQQLASQRWPNAVFTPLFTDVAARCREVAAARVNSLLLMPPWFSSVYFRALVPAVQEIVFLGPRPNWTGDSTSLIGSVLVHLSWSDDRAEDSDGLTLICSQTCS